MACCFASVNKAATVIFWLPSFLTAGWKSSHLLADVTTGSIYGSGAAVPVLGLGWGVWDFKNGFHFLPALSIMTITYVYV
jgi:hypothetical protein